MLTINPINNLKTFGSNNLKTAKTTVAKYTGSGNMSPEALKSWFEKYDVLCNRVETEALKAAKLDEYLKTPEAKAAITP